MVQITPPAALGDGPNPLPIDGREPCFAIVIGAIGMRRAVLRRRWQVADGVYKDTGFVFPSTAAKGGHLVSVKRTWKQVLAHAGIKQRTRLHDLRHGFASMLVSAGYSLPVIGEMLAHVSPQTTKRYAHLDKRVKQEAAAAVADIFTGKRRA